MTNKWLWLTIGAVVVASVAGVVAAQEGLKYPYLPAEYSEPSLATEAEWRALVLTVRLSSFKGACSTDSSAKSAKLILRDIQVHALTPWLMLSVDTDAQPGWDGYLGNGRFTSDSEACAAYEEVAEDDFWEGGLMTWVRVYFPEVADEDVKIHFRIGGHAVGTWQGGKMTLVEVPHHPMPGSGLPPVGEE